MADYKVLLVDDEEEVIQVIMNKIDWKGLGFTISGCAANGVQALEMAEEDEPDVVMTDINMPYMDGLELARRLKKEFSNIKILLFTGYDEFEYAKEAVHLEVEEYILKPINADELTKVFARIRENLDKERSERNNLEKLKNYYMDSLPLFRMNFFTTLIEGSIRKEDVKKYMSDYMIELSDPCYAVSVFHASTHNIPEGMTLVLLNISIEQAIRKRFGERQKIECFTYLGNVVMIAGLQNENGISGLTDECNRFVHTFSHNFGCTLTAGIGTVANDPSDIAESYSTAREAVSYRVIYGTVRAININEIRPFQDVNEDEIMDDSALRDLFKKIRIDGEDEIKKASDVYVDSTLSGITNLRNYKIAVMELVGQIYRFASNNNIDIDKIMGSDGKTDLYKELPEFGVDRIREFLRVFSCRMHAAIVDERNSSSRSFVEKAILYIGDHYSDPDLSLDNIAGAMGVSSSYFSTIFKKETGKTLTSYLTDLRMDKALYLLMEKDEKTYIIAKEVGYQDPNYFSYVFRKRFKMSPSKYKKEHSK